ncbi:uncharacterized protein LOC131065030 [Cryptomeria japonica]|uniref:uncharacterized protein LOC131065030 n=1 Tax=Cryptomeria japonica TaxID=3369 RepID=UPI0027DA7CF1|nr:uncharacterized protein LOC131065030 [Cryptomeria japonica]
MERSEEEKGSSQAQNSIFLGGKTGSATGQHATGDSRSPLEGESLDGKDPDALLDSGDLGGGPRSREDQIVADKGNGQVQNLNLGIGKPEAVQGQQVARSSEDIVEGKESNGKNLKNHPNSRDLKGGPRLMRHIGKWSSLFGVKPKESRALGLKCPSNLVKSQSQNKVWKKVDNSLKPSPSDGLDQEKQPQVGRIEEVLFGELGNETKKGDNEKISHREKDQSGKDSDDRERESQVSTQNKEMDKIEQNLGKSEKRNNGKMNKGDNQSKDNKEEGNNFNSVPSSFESENGEGWIQDAPPDNILEQGLSEISLASPAQVKLIFPEENEPRWGDEEDIKKALGKSETK